MTAQNTVLVGTGGSGTADATVRWAANEARRRNATLHIAHAYDESRASAQNLPHPSMLEVARNHAEVSGTVLGSVGLQLLHHADCPVLIART